MSTIPVLVDAERSRESVREIRSREPTRGGPFSVPGAGPKIAEIDTGKIKNSLHELTANISEMLTDLKNVGEYRLKQVSVSVQISAEGKLFLVGKVGARGGITLTFEP